MAGSLSQNSRGGTTQSEFTSLKVPNPTRVAHGAGSLNQNSTGRDHSIRIQRGGITQSEFTSLKVPNPTRVAHEAGPLSQNSTGRDHSIRIHPPKSSQSHPCRSRGGTTQSEFNGAESLSLTISLKVPNPTRVAHGAGPLSQNSTGRDHSIRIHPTKSSQSHPCRSRGGTTQSEFNGAGSLSLTISLKVPNPTRVVHGAGPLNQNSTGRDHSV